MAVSENTVTRDGLAISYLAMVAPIARAVLRRMPGSIEISDLEGEGQIGLLRAAGSFDPERGVPFPVYARRFVRGAMLDSVRRRHWTASTCEPLTEAPEAFYTPDPEAVVERADQLARVTAALRSLTLRERAILHAYYGPEELLLVEVAERVGVSQTRVFQVRAEALEKLRRGLATEDKAGARRLRGMPSAKVKPIRPPVKNAAAIELEAKQAAEVDELGALEKEIAPLKPKLDRLELLRKSVRSRYDASPAAESFEAKGERFVVMVGARANQSVIDHARLFKAIGAKLFSQIAKTTLKAIEENCSCSVRAEVVSLQQTGARSLKTFERGTPELPKAA